MGPRFEGGRTAFGGAVVSGLVSGITASIALYSAHDSTSAFGGTSLCFDTAGLTGTLLRSSWVWSLPTIALGIFMGQMISLPGASGNALSFLKRLFPGESERFYDVWDFTLSITVSPVLIHVLIEPSTTVIAVSAGLAWNHIVRGTVVGIGRAIRTDALSPSTGIAPAGPAAHQGLKG